MKMKYFLRGLGTGIILCTLVLCIHYRSSEPQGSVVEQAKELGMIFPEGTQPPNTEADLLVSAKPEKTESASTGAGVTGKKENKKKSSGKSKKTKSTAKPEATAKSKATEKPEPTGKAKTTAKPEVTAKPKVTPTRVSAGEEVSITVRKGHTSRSVARELKELGVIGDVLAFDYYLMDNGYAKTIRNGTHKIPMGASFEEIAKIITKTTNN